MSIAQELGAYAKGSLDAAMSRGIITESAKATLLAGLIKMYSEARDEKPFLTEAEFAEQQAAGKVPGLGNG